MVLLNTIPPPMKKGGGRASTSCPRNTVLDDIQSQSTCNDSLQITNISVMNGTVSKRISLSVSGPVSLTRPLKKTYFNSSVST